MAMDRPGSSSRPRLAFTRGETRALIVLALLLLVGLAGQQVRRFLDRDSGGVVLEGAQPLEPPSSSVPPVERTSRTIDSTRLDAPSFENVTSKPTPPEDAGGVGVSPSSAPPAADDAGPTVDPNAGSPAVRPEEGERTVNLNHATAADFEALPGIGPVLARRILDWRGEHGPFKRVDDLLLVRGIGAKRLEKLRPFVTVEP